MIEFLFIVAVWVWLLINWAFWRNARNPEDPRNENQGRGPKEPK